MSQTHEARVRRELSETEEKLLKMGIAGVACAGTSTFLNPVDVTKIKMQVGGKGRTLIAEMRAIVENEGLRGLTRGIEPSVGRELVYGTIRIGGYEPIRNLVAAAASGGAPGGGDNQNTSPFVKYGSALLSGAIGSAIANPFDLVKTRFQAAVVKKGESGTGYPYRNTLQAFSYIIKNEGGFKGLYKGVSPTIARAALVTSSQLGTYDTVKNNILKARFGMKEGYSLHCASAFVAGIAITIASNPADVVKSRYLADSSSEVGKRRYNGVMDCMREVWKERALYRGATAAYSRFAPHTFLSLLAVEKIRQLLGLDGI